MELEGHGDPMFFLFSTECSLGWEECGQARSDYIAHHLYDLTVGLNFLTCKMGTVTISTSRAVVKTKGEVPSVVPGVC